MKLILTFLTLIISYPLFSQSEGQSFCDEFESENYFPLDIEKKKVVWYSTHYFEEIAGTKIINNKEYIEFLQFWGNGGVDTLFLREENGSINQYEEDYAIETLRYDSKLKKGKRWKSSSEGVTYIIKSFKGKLKTPYCDYENLLIIKAKFTSTTYNFYYKKGYGYVGATNKKNNLISYVSPDWKN